MHLERQRDTDELLREAAAGGTGAIDELMQRHRNRLRKMIAVRMDARLAARVDPSDVVQDVLVDASTRLPEYLARRPLPFYPWLRQFAWDRLVELHRRHIGAARRSVSREQPWGGKLPDQSEVELVHRLAFQGTSPSGQMRRNELRERVRGALANLPSRDREVLVLLYLEQLDVNEASEVLRISKKSVTMRHLRALERLRNHLPGDLKESS